MALFCTFVVLVCPAQPLPLAARGILLRVYGILFSIFVIFAELEWSKFTKFFGFLKYWPARGLFYIFVGLITWDQVCVCGGGGCS